VGAWDLERKRKKRGKAGENHDTSMGIGLVFLTRTRVLPQPGAVFRETWNKGVTGGRGGLTWQAH